jgi:diaminopimelate decarboxylase
MFEFRDGSLHAESVPLEAISREFGTPCYVYSRAAFAAALSQFQSACAMCMSSNYNSRPRAAEVMADGAKTHLIRERERPEALFALEHLLR